MTLHGLSSLHVSAPSALLSRNQADRLLHHLEVFETPGILLLVGKSSRPGISRALWSPEVCDLIRTVGSLMGSVTSHREDIIDTASFARQPALLLGTRPDLLFELLFRHIRCDSVYAGHLASVLKSGHILAILRRLRELRPTLPA